MRRTLLLAMTAVAAAAWAGEPPTMIVRVEVADVRSEPSAGRGVREYDPHEETQVLKGEPVLVLERRNGWVRVQCPEQPEFTHHNVWEGYPGWIRAKDVSSDLRLRRPVERAALTIEESRSAVLDQAARHLDSPYFWGGRSLYNPRSKSVTGVDCSGLVNWSFRQIGWIVPRDAHEQWMKAKRIEPAALKIGDLVFLAKPDKPEKIVHVAFYAGNGMILEAPQTGERVRRIGFQERFGRAAAEVKNGETVGDRVIYFGTFFEEGS